MESRRLTFDEFCQTVCQRTAESLGHNFIIKDVEKENGINLTALMMSDENINVAPSLYLNDEYDIYFAHNDIDKACSEIAARYNSIFINGKEFMESKIELANQITDFEKIKDRIIVKIINKYANKNLLPKRPFKTVNQDLAATYRICVDNSKDGVATIAITDELMAKWDVNKETLHNLAISNTERMFPAKVQSMFDVLNEMMPGTMTEDINDPDVPKLIVITNKEKTNGASVMLYDNLLKDVSNKFFDGKDMIILPSSIHEVIATEYSSAKLAELEDIVGQANSTVVSNEDFLSDSVYQYDSSRNKVINISYEKKLEKEKAR